MKKILPVVVAGFLILGGLGAVAVSVNNEKQFLIVESFYFSQPSFSETNDYTVVMLSEATSNMMQMDKPYLPVTSKVYVFPFGTAITDVTVSFGAFNEVSLEKPVMLSPEPQMVSPVLQQTTVEQNPVIQSAESWYPSSLYHYRVGSGINNGDRVVFLVVHLFPVSCKQTEKRIRYYEDATIDISYTPPANPVIFGNAYELLILTPAQFTTGLQPLVNYKNDNGIATFMVSLTEIYGGNYFPVTGKDNQEKIKYFIKNAIESWGITSVILVGAGVEGQEVFPVRNAWIASDSYEQYFPSDLYYADIYNSQGGFSSWDYNNNGKYCEYPWDLPAVDLYPDVYLGRLACNDAGEVTAVVNKIISFKEYNKMMNKILQLAGDTFPGDDGNINEGEYANTEVMKKLPGYVNTRLWASLGTLTKDNIRSNINRGYDFVDISGHGSWASWATHPPNDDRVWLPAETFYSPYAGFLYIDVDLFINSRKLPVFVLNACSTSKFSESPTCLGWKIVSKSNGGGIASFGASGIGYGMLGKDITTRLLGWMEVRLFQELYTTKNLGRVWANALNGYVNSFFMIDPADYKTVVELTLLGDPTTVIEDGKQPRSFNFAWMNNLSLVLQGMQQTHRSLFLSKLLVLKQATGQQTQN